MWTKEHRERAVVRAKKLTRYPSDLTDEEWALIEPLMPQAYRTGRRREVDLREVVNAIRYPVRSGCELVVSPVCAATAVCPDP